MTEVDDIQKYLIDNAEDAMMQNSIISVLIKGKLIILNDDNEKTNPIKVLDNRYVLIKDTEKNSYRLYFLVEQGVLVNSCYLQLPESVDESKRIINNFINFGMQEITIVDFITGKDKRVNCRLINE